MTDKKTTETEKQAEKKQPTELKDEQLDEAQGGVVIPSQFPVLVHKKAPKLGN